MLRDVRYVPIADSYTATKAVRDGAHSGRRAADEPHRTGKAHSRAVQMRRQRLADRRGGGRDDVRPLRTKIKFARQNWVTADKLIDCTKLACVRGCCCAG